MKDYRWPNTVTNAAFALAGGVALFFDASAMGITFAATMVVLAVTSALWHWHGRHPYNVYDRYGMYLVLAALMAALVHIWWVTFMVWGALYLLGRLADSSFTVIGIAVAIILFLMALSALWVHLGIMVLLGAGALWANFSDRPRLMGPRHAIWHLAAAPMLLVVFLGALSTWQSV